MKLSFDLSSVAIFGSTLAFSLLLSACGQKGPLFMPKIPPLAPQPSGSSTGAATPGEIVQPGPIQGSSEKVLPTTPMAPQEPTGPDTISQ